MSPGRRRVIRPIACGATAVVGWHVLNAAWRSVEASIVAGAATLGPGSVDWRGGDQLLVSGAVHPFVVVIGPGCSSVGPVLVALAVGAAFARTWAAARAVALAAALLVVGNLLRMVAVVVVGASSGAADLELAHDGWATWWAVAVVLVATGIVAVALRRTRGAPARQPAPVAGSGASSGSTLGGATSR